MLGAGNVVDSNDQEISIVSLLGTGSCFAGNLVQRPTYLPASQGCVSPVHLFAALLDGLDSDPLIGYATQ